MRLEHGIARFELDPARRVPLLDQPTLERLREALSAAGRDAAKVFIVSGGNNGVFAAGADLAHLATLDPNDAREFARHGQEILDGPGTGTFVSIAVIRGQCIGGSFDLAMACDIRLADTTASFSHPGPRLGFITGYGGTSRLPGLIGPSAMMVLAGRRVLDAAKALELGLLAAVTSPNDLSLLVDEMARRIASVPAERIKCIKEVVRYLGASSSRRRLESPVSRLAALAGACGKGA